MQMGVLGKPNEMVEAIKIFRKEKTYDIIKKSLYDISLDKCKIATVHHGDFWSNNFFLNQENSKVLQITNKVQYKARESTCRIRQVNIIYLNLFRPI